MNCKEHQRNEEQPLGGCTALTYQSAEVSVPISVRPKVCTGIINTFCCGEPNISPSPYTIVCNSKPGNCSFTLTQNICIEIPIEISAEAVSGCLHIECGEVSGKMCEDCGG